ncbi:hypothetical protein M426DRAFT_326018 [Hypoxylon sp. CI-4A]|nr:hypothetical protein M426DRAFT_326018 [Hypoxylon sp. CI-4A]
MGNEEIIESEDSFPREATKEEIENLTHEPDDIPVTAWLLTFTGAASQLARFGCTVAWQNYLQNPRGNPHLPGALGLGESTATIIQNAFLFFQYLTPLPLGLISDAWLGRYRIMVISLAFLVVGYTLLFTTSLPAALNHGTGLGGIIGTIFLIGIGHGGMSAVMYAFIGDQIPETRPIVKRNKRGELVVTDRKLSIQYVFNGYYWMANIASLSSIPTTFMEKYIDFWAAYLLPTALLIVAVIPVIFWNKKLVKPLPQGNILPQAGRVVLIACRSGFKLSAADPDYQKVHHDRTVPWTASFVGEISRGLRACRVIVCFVIFWLCYNQTNNNIISQAGQMEQQGISNDTIQALNPIFCILLGPVIQKGLFPFLRRRKIAFGPIRRMAVALIFIAAGIAYAAGLQQLIYSKGPCFDHPLECPAAVTVGEGNPARPNEVSIWLQTPLHFLLAVGEILGIVSLNEFTYAEAPTNMKAVVLAFQQLAAAVGAALGAALGPVSKNPQLVILYACLAGTMAISAVLFWLVFRRYDAVFEKTQHEDASDNNESSSDVEGGRSSNT